MSRRAKQKAAQIDLVRRLGSRDPEVVAHARIELDRLLEPMWDALYQGWRREMRGPDSLDKSPHQP